MSLRIMAPIIGFDGTPKVLEQIVDANLRNLGPHAENVGKMRYADCFYSLASTSITSRPACA
jgi:hypothetical protein